MSIARFSLFLLVLLAIVVPVASSLLDCHERCGDTDCSNVTDCRCLCRLVTTLPADTDVNPVLVVSPTTCSDQPPAVRSHARDGIDHPPRRAA